jgi:hypothetical protein
VIRRSGPGGGPPQPEPLFRGAAGLADLVVVVPEPRPCPVLAGQHRHQVKVIRSMPDRHPADRLIVLAMRGQPGPVHNVAGDLRPLLIGEHPVPRGGPDRAVPHRPLEPAGPARRVAAEATRPGGGSRGACPDGAPAPARPGRASRPRGAGSCALRCGRARIGSTAAQRPGCRER